MQDKFLKETLGIIIGKPAEELTKLISTKRHINEFTIATKLEITINQTRNLLYRISDYGLVSSIRKKDDKKGWYTYFWRLEKIKTLRFLEEILEKQIKQLNDQMEHRTSSQFYICKLCKIEKSEQQALMCDFTCDECGQIFETKNDAKTIRDIKRNTSRFQNKLDLLQIEVAKEDKRLAKIKAKEIARKEAEKQALRKEKRAIAAKKRAEKKALKEAEDLKNGILPKKKVVKKKKAKKKVAKKKAAKKKTVKKKITKKKK